MKQIHTHIHVSTYNHTHPKENVTVNQFYCGFFEAAQATELSDPRNSGPDRVRASVLIG